MNFRDFYEMSSLMDIIGPVPQSPKWHSEGPVGKHTRMVRKGLERAVQALQIASRDQDSAFSELDTNFTKEDINLLRIGAWMHDVGKAKATTVGGNYWKPGQEVSPEDMYTIKAKKHEKPEFFEPMMQKLGPVWHDMYKQAGSKDISDLWYIIKHHMSLREGGFGKRLSDETIDTNGKYKPNRKVKLLLALIIMDWMGRTGEVGGGGATAAAEALEYMQKSADMRVLRHKRSLNQSTALPDDEQGFIQALIDKGKPLEIIKMAFKSKFGKDMP